ncbi:uncharacterized protein METZ01_LOCUS94406 [marine metagenome]|uniref:Uncharacterized protein n=1 Tax=marine metagenome TaxID=408172 RepID=A0A381VMP0_9ZZZZ
MATAQYNQQISQINAQMEKERGRIVRSITERNADVLGENAVYNAYLLDKQAGEIEDQNQFDFFMKERQYDIFTAEKRAKWGTSGVTMAGSPAVVALADAQAAALNLANIEQRGLQAVSRMEQAAEMTRYKGKVEYNNMMQQAFMGQYASDIQRANIINQGNMDYMAGASKAYSAQQKATAALISGLSSAAASAAGGFTGGGGGVGFGPSSTGFTSAAQNQAIFGQTPMQSFGPLPQG